MAVEGSWFFYLGLRRAKHVAALLAVEIGQTRFEKRFGALRHAGRLVGPMNGGQAKA